MPRRTLPSRPQSDDLCAEYSLTCRGDEARLRSMLSEVSGLSELFGALADETRVRILYLLVDRELCVCDLAHLLGMTLPAISHHLRVLRMTRLVRPRREGKRIFYALDDDHVLSLIRVAQEHYVAGT